MDRLMTIREAAQVLHLHPTTVAAWARSGRIPSRQLGDRRLFTTEDLATFIESCAIEPATQGRPR